MRWRFGMTRLAAAAVAVFLASTARAQTLELKPGDRISLVGNTLADRLQHDGWFETYFHSRFPKHQLSFRNLGFSGDEVTQRIRSSAFGSPDDWLNRTKADVVFLFFGYNESFQGEAGLAKFKSDLDNYVGHLLKQKYNGTAAPRVVLFSPISHENLKTPHLPDGSANNARLKLYAGAIAEVAKGKNLPYVDLLGPTAQAYAAAANPLTLNGVHLNEAGNEQVAKIVDKALFANQPEPKRTTELMEKIRRSVQDTNFHWFQRYRTTDGFSIYGGRADLKFVGGQTNRVVMQREMEVLDVMTANREKATWDVAQGKPAKVDDGNLPPFVPVQTNKPGKGPNGQHLFLDGEEAIKSMTLGKNIKVQLFASEKQFPELVNPVQMTFDPQGRLWVAVWPTYPHWKPTEEMNDKILVFEDTDGDGKADKMTVFADNLHNPTGFELWNGGVLVANAPDLMFLKDTDGDGKADVRTRVLNGLCSADTHHTANSFVLDPGGALYFQEGTFHHTQVETPWGPSQRCANAGVFRYEPRAQKFEVYVNHGFANPHGHVFDRWGQDIVVDGTGANPFHATLFSGQVDFPNRHGRPPQVYKQRTRPCPGMEYLSSRHFPDEWQGHLLVPNVIGFQGILRYQVYDQGASFGAKEQEVLLQSSDPHFRPTDLRVGPDGAIYFIDWHNPIIGHMQHNLRDPSRDRSHGRIYRVTYEGRPLSPKAKIAGEPITKLLDLLKHDEDRVRYRARIELTARPTADTLAALSTWVAKLDEKDKNYEHHMLEALWLHQSHDVVNEDLLRRTLRSPDFRARAAATRVLCYWRDRVSKSLDTVRMQVNDSHPRVRLEAIRALSFFHGEEPIAAAVELLAHPTDEYLNFTFNETMNTLERRVGGKVNRANIAATFLGMLDKPGVTPERRATLVESVARHGGAKEIETILAKAADKDAYPAALRRKTLDWVADAVLTRQMKPKADAQTFHRLVLDSAVQVEAIRLAAALKVDVVTEVRRLASNAVGEVRYAAIDALATYGQTDALKQLSATGPTEARFRASAALGRLDVKAGAEAAAKALAGAKDSDDPASVIEGFLQRKQGSDELAAALGASKLSVDVAKQSLRAMYLAGRNDAKLNAVLSKFAGLDAAPKPPTLDEVRKLGDLAMAQGDAQRGERIFRRAELGCVKCHALHKAGGAIGPDLGPVGGASPMDYIVSSILDPNASVKEEYLTKTIVTSAGLALTGIVVEKTPQYTVLKDATGKKIKVAQADIEEEAKGKTLMPEGVTRILTQGELLDLIRFVSELGKPGPYAMPKDVTLQRWKKLRTVSPELASAVPTREGIRDGIHGASPDAFDAVTALVSGKVPLDELRKGTGPQVLYLVSEFDVTRAGSLDVIVDGPASTAFWINEAPHDKAGTARSQLLAGRNRVTIRVVAAEGASVRVELRRPSDSTIQYEFPASE